MYLSIIRVFAQDDTALQYAKLTKGFDPSFDTEDYATAREFGGYTGFTVQDGYVVVGDSDAPFVHKYRITEDLQWEEVGDPLNFGDIFMAGDGLNDHFQAKRGNDQLTFYGADRTSRLHWKVQEWTLAGDYTDTNLPTRSGWVLRNGGNRGRLQSFQDAVIWPFVLEPDTEMGTMGAAETYLAVYDGTTFEEKNVVKTSSVVTIATKDEDGNVYYSGGENPLLALYGLAPSNAIVKFKPDGSLDASFGENGERSYEALTELALPGVSFRYVGRGKAVVGLLDYKKLDITSFEGDIPDEIFCQVVSCGDFEDRFPEELWDDYRTDIWSQYLVDLKTKAVQKITGHRDPVEATWVPDLYRQVDGRTFFDTRYGDGLYELNLETGAVTLVDGVVFKTPEGQPAVELSNILRVR